MLTGISARSNTPSSPTRAIVSILPCVLGSHSRLSPCLRKKYTPRVSHVLLVPHLVSFPLSHSPCRVLHMYVYCCVPPGGTAYSSVPKLAFDLRLCSCACCHRLAQPCTLLVRRKWPRSAHEGQFGGWLGPQFWLLRLISHCGQKEMR